MAEAELKRRGLSREPQTLAEAEPARRAEAELQELERYRNATTHRLKKLLDMAEYDVTTSRQESVMYEEATREIGIIQSELKHRK